MTSMTYSNIALFQVHKQIVYLEADADLEEAFETVEDDIEALEELIQDRVEAIASKIEEATGRTVKVDYLP